MGNPHPTKSRPCKIGRKHLGLPSLRVIGNRKSTAIANQKRITDEYRKFKEKVSEYWKGEREDYPRFSA